MSSSHSGNSKRVRQAIQGSDMSQSSVSQSSVSQSSVSQSSDQPQTDESSPRVAPSAPQGGSALSLPRHRSHSMDNRPVDPSPIQVSHTVSMAGQRPIGIASEQGPVRFDTSKRILNRPIAPNSTAADDALLEYLD